MKTNRSVTSHATPQQDLRFQLESNYRYETVEPRYYGPSSYRSFPVRLTIPVPAGTYTSTDGMVLHDAGGLVVPSVAHPLLSWPDGSVRVWDVSFAATINRPDHTTCELRRGKDSPSLPGNALSTPPKVTISMTLEDGTTLRREIALPPPVHGKTGIAVEEREVEFELAGKDKSVAFRGAIVRRSWSWYPASEFSVRLVNFGNADEIRVREVRLEFDLPGSGASRYAVWHSTPTAHSPRLAEGTIPPVVHADAGTVCVTDVAQVGIVEADFAPYERGTYLRMVDNWVAMTDSDAAWVLVVPEAAERWPKGWSLDGRHATIELHPGWAEPLVWRQGMALFQRFVLSRQPADSTGNELMDEGRRWIRPPVVTVDADVYRAAGWRIPFRYDLARYPRTEFTIRETWNFEWHRGTFDWGDDGGTKRRNHEYDFIANAAKEFARTGRTELSRKCRAAAEHMMYTDFVAHSNDPWTEGGVPAHCIRHTTGSAYPSHMWTEGLLLYHMLSGDLYALKVAMRVGDFFLKYVRERFQVVQATAREMGWAMVALASLYDTTHEKRYLDGARTIVDFYLERGVADFFPTDATFCIGVAVIGFDRARAFYRKKDIRQFILGVLDSIMANRCDAMGIFDYWYDSERKAFPYIQAHLPEALNIGYKLSGDIKYLKAAWRLFQVHQHGGPLTVENKNMPPESGYAGGYHIAWTMGCLQSFAEQGWLAKVQYVEP